MPPEENKKTDDKNNDLDLSKNPQFAQLMGVVQQIGKNQQALQTSLQSMSTSLETLSKGGGRNVEDDNKKKGPTDEDINNMSQVELTQHLFGGVRKMLDGLKGDIEKSVSKIAETTEEGRLETQVEKLRGAHKDFDEWIPEIKEKIRSTNASISVGEAYTLVRNANPEKAKQMDEKYEELDPNKDKSSGASSTFGGLTPTSRQSSSGGSDEDKKSLSRQEAGEKAWEEAFGENPALAGEDTD